MIDSPYHQPQPTQQMPQQPPMYQQPVQPPVPPQRNSTPAGVVIAAVLIALVCGISMFLMSLGSIAFLSGASRGAYSTSTLTGLVSPPVNFNENANANANGFAASNAANANNASTATNENAQLVAPATPSVPANTNADNPTAYYRQLAATDPNITYDEESGECFINNTVLIYAELPDLQNRDLAAIRQKTEKIAAKYGLALQDEMEDIALYRGVFTDGRHLSAFEMEQLIDALDVEEGIECVFPDLLACFGLDDEYDLHDDIDAYGDELADANDYVKSR